jgi:hypothetical protein
MSNITLERAHFLYRVTLYERIYEVPEYARRILASLCLYIYVEREREKIRRVPVSVTWSSPTWVL